MFELGAVVASHKTSYHFVRIPKLQQTNASDRLMAAMQAAIAGSRPVSEWQQWAVSDNYLDYRKSLSS